MATRLLAELNSRGLPRLGRSKAWRCGLLVGVVALLAIGGAPPVSSEEGQAAIDERMARAVEESAARLIEIRRDIHRHPEIAGSEERTARVVAEHLGRLGFEVGTGVGGHGVVGVLRGRRPGAVVGFRADMDAVAMAAPDPVEFRSTVPGVRHVCGHDLHVAVGLGIAEAFAAGKRDFSGTLVLVFQPAEETAEGARAMIDDGVFERVTPGAVPDAMFAFHAAPLEVGTVGSTNGLVLPHTAIATISLRASPDATAPPDFEPAAMEVAQLLQGLVELGPPADPAGVAALNGLPLSSDFVVPQLFSAALGAESDRFDIRALIRMSKPAKLGPLREKIAAGIGDLEWEGIEHEISYLEGAMPALLNDRALVSEADAAFARALGETAVVRMGGGVAFFGEDFGHFLAERPGAMYWLGVANAEKGIVGMPHAPDFVADEGAISAGAKGMSTVLLDFLERRAADL